MFQGQKTKANLSKKVGHCTSCIIKNDFILFPSLWLDLSNKYVPNNSLCDQGYIGERNSLFLLYIICVKEIFQWKWAQKENIFFWKNLSYHHVGFSVINLTQVLKNSTKFQLFIIYIYLKPKQRYGNQCQLYCLMLVIAFDKIQNIYRLIGGVPSAFRWFLWFK